jgi:enoyl-CoA hydratase/carnithine racemase
MSDVVTLQVDDGVAVLTLNRPDRLNAWTDELEVRYFDLLDECAQRPDVGAIVVTGAGRAFCAGVDMDELTSVSTAGGKDAVPENDRPQTHPTSIPKPIVAAINGACAGLGVVQALMCDVRFVAAEAKLTTSFARRGLIAEHGISWVLPRLVGLSTALDLLLSGRVILGEEAVRLGLATWVAPREEVLDQAVAYARELATLSSPVSMAVMKRQLWSGSEQTLPAVLEEADALMEQFLARPDFAEGVASFVERRPPRFAAVTGTADLPSVA